MIRNVHIRGVRVKPHECVEFIIIQQVRPLLNDRGAESRKAYCVRDRRGGKVSEIYGGTEFEFEFEFGDVNIYILDAPGTVSMPMRRSAS